MLFNSHEFLCFFLPISAVGYFALHRSRCAAAAKGWLMAASFFFYGWWDARYLPLLLGSIAFNYTVGLSLTKTGEESRLRGSAPWRLGFGVACNLALLAYFKYADFFLETVNLGLDRPFPLPHLVLPLGISFFTFTQIAYLVDAYKGAAKEYHFANYALFVSFFPHLLAGPIIHHKEMMPQFDARRNRIVNYANLSKGLFLFSIGLFKKVMIADTLSQWANVGFDRARTLTFLEAWATSLSYTLQLYFDFSGYTDMALGVALMFNIKLPINFNSPYRATDIRDFWRRWHITLSRFLREYVYIPLGGNKVGEARVCANLLLTFLLGGLWHGAGWLFVLWGGLHGLAIVVHRLWQRVNMRMPDALAWLLTFNFVNATWVLFRARSWDDAKKVLGAMAGGTIAPSTGASILSLGEWSQAFARLSGGFQNLGLSVRVFATLCVAAFAVMCLRNSNELVERFEPRWGYSVMVVAILLGYVIQTEYFKIKEFLYFQF